MKAKEIKVEDLGGGITRQILGYGDDIMLVRVLFKKGAVGVLHRHDHRQVSYVESGSFEVEIDGEKSVLNHGDCFYVPKNLLHGCVCLEDGVLIDVFTPHREEFLNGK
ncbi:MAG: cupin domain-containing protein [Calditrichia bacterium]